MRAEGFEAFVAARAPALMRTAFLMTGDAQHAEDVLQEALVRVAPRWRRVVAAGDPEPYVRRALYTVAIDRRRRRSSREVVTAPDDGVFTGAAAGSGDDGLAGRLTLDAALARLTPRQRAVLVLRFYDDLTEVQTAAALGCSLSTVKSQTVHALGRLRVLAPELATTFGRTPARDADAPSTTSPSRHTSPIQERTS